MNRRDQFFGFIDSVGVFDRALTAAAAAGLAGERIGGNEPDLVAGLNCDRYALRRVPSKVDHTPGYQGSAYRANTGGPDDPVADTRLLPEPVTAAALRLPLPVNQTWEVIQGINNFNGSHRGYAAFTLDLIFVAPGTPTGALYQGQQATLNQPVVAAAAGQVTAVDALDTNVVAIRHDEGEFSAYLHLRGDQGIVNPGDFVDAGDTIGLAGASGVANPNAYCLHFGVNDNATNEAGTLATFPFAFTDYEVSDDFGVTWRHVDSGRLMAGQWVRRMP